MEEEDEVEEEGGDEEEEEIEEAKINTCLEMTSARDDLFRNH